MNPLRRTACPGILFGGCNDYFCKYLHRTGRETSIGLRRTQEQEYGKITCPHEWEISAVGGKK
jgi:hypothetical protein